MPSARPKPHGDGPELDIAAKPPVSGRRRTPSYSLFRKHCALGRLWCLCAAYYGNVGSSGERAPYPLLPTLYETPTCNIVSLLLTPYSHANAHGVTGRLYSRLVVQVPHPEELDRIGPHELTCIRPSRVVASGCSSVRFGETRESAMVATATLWPRSHHSRCPGRRALPGRRATDGAC